MPHVWGYGAMANSASQSQRALPAAGATDGQRVSSTWVADQSAIILLCRGSRCYVRTQIAADLSRLEAPFALFTM